MTQELPSISEKPTTLVVMLHGIGSDGADLIQLAPFIQPTFPECHFFSPDGVEPYDLAPFGKQWFSLKSSDPKLAMDAFKINIPKIIDIIQKKQTELNLTNNQTILMGFSQGAMISVYLTLTEKNQPFAATISFAGRLLPVDAVENIKTPICIIHGGKDNILSQDESINMASYCNKLNIKHDLLLVSNLTHSIDMNSIDFAIKFLKLHLPQL